MFQPQFLTTFRELVSFIDVNNLCGNLCKSGGFFTCPNIIKIKTLKF